MFDGDTFEHNGRNFRVEFPFDEFNEAPWDREDGHGAVTDWTTRAKAPGEMELCRDGRLRRFYDFAGAVATAKHDGWDAAPYSTTETKGQRAHKAAMADFERLRRWCTAEWTYIGVVVHLLDDAGDDMGESESLWGIESDSGAYLDATARELAEEIIYRLAKTLAA